jgi:hypothetical protein
VNTKRNHRFKNEESKTKVSEMPTDIDQPRVQRSRASMSNSAAISVAIVLAGFAILHVIGAAMLQPKSAKLPADGTGLIAHGD